MSELSNIRTGRITSSEIVSLTSNGRRDMSDIELEEYKKENPKGTRKTIDCFGAPFYTYVEECIMERFFKHKLENETEVKAFSWGKMCEIIVHDLLPMDYIMQSEVTEVHPKHSEWVGTPDAKKMINGKIDTITDTKCPLTRKAFYNLIKRLYDFDGLTVTKKENVDGNDIIKLIRSDSKEGEKYYWQLVSNACILDAKYAELIVFMPYYEDLETLREYNRTLDEPYWLIERAKDGELPFIYKETGIENINIIRFIVPEEDKLLLESRVISALELINK
jgi:hypothetical protein